MGMYFSRLTGTKYNYPVDFVITWVDGSDQEWLSEKKRYLVGETGKIDSSERRYRDWGLLKYLFRGIESYAPWVRKVFFLTYGHLPKWLDVEAKGLVVVRHDQFIPNEYLPTFSSRPIELNMHRIPNLAERFVYFNDDMFLTKPVSPDVFFQGGLPVLPPQLHGILPGAETGVMAHTYVNNVSALNRHFSFKDCLSANRWKWFDPRKVGIGAALENAYCSRYAEFLGFRHWHLPVPLMKTTMRSVWEAETTLLDSTCRNRFRGVNDVSPYLLWHWQLASGEFVPCRSSHLGKYYILNEETAKEVTEVIREHRHRLICVNDMGGLETEEAFEMVSREVAAAFDRILPNKSKFEL